MWVNTCITWPITRVLVTVLMYWPNELTCTLLGGWRIWDVFSMRVGNSDYDKKKKKKNLTIDHSGCRVWKERRSLHVRPLLWIPKKSKHIAAPRKVNIFVPVQSQFSNCRKSLPPVVLYLFYMLCRICMKYLPLEKCNNELNI